MPQFHIYSKEVLVGWSELELGDPPMGVAFGRFIPAQSYEQIQPSVISSMEKDQSVLSLSVRLPDGTELECVGVCIADYSAEAGDDGLEVSVLGICNPPYEQLFPQHVAAYERQFSGGG